MWNFIWVFLAERRVWRNKQCVPEDSNIDKMSSWYSQNQITVFTKYLSDIAKKSVLTSVIWNLILVCLQIEWCEGMEVFPRIAILTKYYLDIYQIFPDLKFSILTKSFLWQVCRCMEFNLGLLQIEASEETSIVPKGSDIEILPTAKKTTPRKKINVNESLDFPWCAWVGKLITDKFYTNQDKHCQRHNGPRVLSP